MVKKRIERKAPITSRKPLVGEALYDKLMEDEFTSITMNQSRLIKEDWTQVNAQEEALLHAMVVSIPALKEPDYVKESMLLGERIKLADLYHRSGLESDNVAGAERVEEFVKRAQAAIKEINGKPELGKGLH